MFWSAGCSLLRAEGFSCSLNVLLGGLGISKLNFLSNIFSTIIDINPRIRIHLKCWIEPMKFFIYAIFHILIPNTKWVAMMFAMLLCQDRLNVYKTIYLEPFVLFTIP